MNGKNPFEPTLTDRYIWEALRQIPKERKRKAANDIERAVQVRVKETVDSGTNPEQAEYQALVELGEPRLWARAYQDHPLQLIGPNYYLEWRHAIFSLLLTVVLAISLTAAYLNFYLGFSLSENIIGTLLLAGTMTVHVCFWVTLLFHVIERYGRRFSHKWDPDNLPEAPSNSLPSMYDIVLALTLMVLIPLLALWQQIRSPVAGGGKQVPILNPEMWNLWIPLIFCWLVLNVFYVIWMYRHGRWTFRGAFLNTLFNLAIAVPIIWLSLSGQFLNIEFFKNIGVEDQFRAGGFGSFMLAAGIAAMFIWDMADSFIRADKRRIAHLRRKSNNDVAI